MRLRDHIAAETLRMNTPDPDLFTDAYSYPDYTPSGWRHCLKLLKRRGYADPEIEAIMRSKHTRYAADNARNKGRREGCVTSADLMRWIDITCDHGTDLRPGSVYMDRLVLGLMTGGN